jgi:hypothetical protein
MGVPSLWDRVYMRMRIASSVILYARVFFIRLLGSVRPNNDPDNFHANHALTGLID